MFKEDTVKHLINVDVYYPRLQFVQVANPAFSIINQSFYLAGQIDTIETMPIVSLVSNIGGTIGKEAVLEG